jgi:hypothetical protein
MLSVTCKPYVLSAVVLNVVMLSVVMLNVVAPTRQSLPRTERQQKRALLLNF